MLRKEDIGTGLKERTRLPWGLRPQTPGIYRFGANPEEETKTGGESRPSFGLGPWLRRSGRFPPLPYPPPR